MWRIIFRELLLIRWGNRTLMRIDVRLANHKKKRIECTHTENSQNSNLHFLIHDLHSLQEYMHGMLLSYSLIPEHSVADSASFLFQIGTRIFRSFSLSVCAFFVLCVSFVKEQSKYILVCVVSLSLSLSF